MTDREMLLLAYGAIRTVVGQTPELGDVVDLLQEHLFPVPSDSDDNVSLGRAGDEQ